MAKKLHKSDEFDPVFNRLIDICELHGTSVSNLLDEFTTSRSAISAWKKGNINTDVLIKIADKFKLTLDFLLTGKENSSSSELSENEQRIIDIFKSLTETQQGQLIGRAEMLAEMNEEVYRQEDIG